MTMGVFHKLLGRPLPLSRLGKVWALFLGTFWLSLTLVLASPQVAQAQSWLNLIFQGIQYLQLANLSDQQEVRIGQQVNQQLISQGQFIPVRNPKLNQYINDLGQRLAQTSSRPQIPYRFQVARDDAVNAFATMGGYVYINTGLIMRADNEAELASVIAHEIAHIAARHSVGRMRDLALSEGLMSAAGLRESTIVQMMVTVGVNLPMSRDAELEADQLGLKNLMQAGYAPGAMVTFMKKLQSPGFSPPELLSTHPLTQKRVQALQASIDPQQAYQGDGLDTRAYQTQIRSLLGRPDK